MGARVYNAITNQFTSPDPVKGGNENSYTYPNDPINGSDFTGLWSWWDTLDVVMTVASFIPVTAGIAAAVRVGVIVYKAASLVNKAQKIVEGAKNIKVANEMWGTVKASRSVSGLAGRIWAKGAKFENVYKGQKSTKAIVGLRNGKPVQYRPPTLKNGNLASNLEQFATKHNYYATQPRYNFHIEISRGFFK